MRKWHIDETSNGRLRPLVDGNAIETWLSQLAVHSMGCFFFTDMTPVAAVKLLGCYYWTRYLRYRLSVRACHMRIGPLPAVDVFQVDYNRNNVSPPFLPICLPTYYPSRHSSACAVLTLVTLIIAIFLMNDRLTEREHLKSCVKRQSSNQITKNKSRIYELQLAIRTYTISWWTQCISPPMCIARRYAQQTCITMRYTPPCPYTLLSSPSKAEEDTRRTKFYHTTREAGFDFVWCSLLKIHWKLSQH